MIASQPANEGEHIPRFHCQTLRYFVPNLTVEPCPFHIPPTSGTLSETKRKRSNFKFSHLTEMFAKCWKQQGSNIRLSCFSDLQTINYRNSKNWKKKKTLKRALLPLDDTIISKCLKRLRMTRTSEIHNKF